MSEERFNLRDMTKQFIENITQGNYEESVRSDGLLVEAKKKEPDYGDGAYFTGGPAADVKAREDAWAGGDNLFNAIDQSKAAGSEPVTKEQEIMSITELRAMIQREMGVLSEMTYPSSDWPSELRSMMSIGSQGHKPWEPYEILAHLEDNVYQQSLLTTFRQFVLDERKAGIPDGHIISRWLQRRDRNSGQAAEDLMDVQKGAHFLSDPFDDPEDVELGPEDLPTEEAPMSGYGQELGGGMTQAQHMAALQQQWREETG